MSNWFQILREQLQLPNITADETTVPFGIGGIASEAWHVAGIQSAGNSEQVLTAHTDDGAEVQWHMRFFPDTRAVECWGQLTNRGSRPLQNLSECLTWDLDLSLQPGFGEPWIRRVNGVQFLPNFFPPHDFAIVDRQLLKTPQVYAPFDIMAGDGGRPSDGHLPCAIVCDGSRSHGFALFLEWAGLWRISLTQETREVNDPDTDWPVRLQAGLWGLALHLQPGQSLPLPRILLTAFDGNLDDGGNALRRHIRRHVTPSLDGQEVLPPATFNHWFAFENDYTDQSLRPAVDASAAAGLEYFCVDGGWFAGDFRDGIGNWSEGDPKKFPNGIAPFADYVRSKGLKYGTWFEPEWANKDSEIYRDHPDWFWETPERPPVMRPGFHFQHPEFALINLGLPEVRQWWLDRFVRAYEEWGMRWVRWDYNQDPRANWERNVPQGDIGWRQVQHVQGFYQVLDDILEACPELFIEQCASGGHRIDLGTVRRGHSFWMNDHTTHSALVRVLQHGLNTVLPGNYANTNICQQRHDFTTYDYLSHAAGGFGYSGKLWEAPAADFERYRAAVADFKSYRDLLMGNYQRPTGQPASADEYAQVIFSDGGRSVTMEFNADSPGSASLTMT